MSIDGGLRPMFREKLRHFHWTSVETGSTQGGVLDSEFCYQGHQGWLEFKTTETGRIRRTDAWAFQIAWMERRARAGGRCFVAVRQKHDGGPRKGLTADELWLLDGRQASAIDSYGLVPRISYVLGRWTGGPARWDWSDIERILLTHDC